MKKLLLTILSISIAVVAVLLILFAGNFPKVGCDIVTNYCVSTYEILILFLIFFVLFIILSTRMEGDIDFSLKSSRIKLMESVIWILIIWFVIPALIYFFIPINIFYTHVLSEYDLRDAMIFLLPWKISIFMILTIPIWKHWILKPLYFWIKNLNKVNQKQICPFCSEKIKLSAIVCKHCGRDIKSSE